MRAGAGLFEGVGAGSSARVGERTMIYFAMMTPRTNLRSVFSRQKLSVWANERMVPTCGKRDHWTGLVNGRLALSMFTAGRVGGR